MPKVIYCLHALSTHLFKRGQAPLIQDLFGKVDFSGKNRILFCALKKNKTQKISFFNLKECSILRKIM